MSTSTVSSTAAQRGLGAVLAHLHRRQAAPDGALGVRARAAAVDGAEALEPGAAGADERARGPLGCDNSNVTGIVDRLEARGLVERRRAEHDRRVKSSSRHRRGRSSCARVVERRMSVPPRRSRGSPTRTQRPCATSCSARDQTPDERARRPGPTYFAVGRISRPSRFCSRMCADQPATRAQVNMDVNSVGRHLGEVEHDRRPELDVRGQHAVGLARLAARRARPSRAPRRPRSAGSRSPATCAAARGRAGPRRGRRGGRSPSGARRGRARP